MDGLMYTYLHRFVNLTDDECSFIGQFAEIRHFDKKVRLVNIGEPEQYVNFVVRGLLKKFFYDRRKEEILTQIAKEGDLISSSVSLLSGEISEYSVETIEPSTVISFSKKHIETIYRQGYRMERLGRLIVTDWFLKKEYWELARLRSSPKQRFLTFITSNPDLLMRVPQKSLASYLNIKPETFSRYKHLLVQKPYLQPQINDIVVHY